MDITDSQKAQCILVIVTVSLGIIAIVLISLSVVRYIRKSKKVTLRTFYVWLGMLAILGGTWAFFLPIAINSGFNKNDDGPVLRQLLIYTTGGLLGAITLGETRRKNDQDHTRQVHAERRSRYTTAVEQLSSDKASIRLGGVYTLAKLVDDWLDDEKTLPSKKERRQEGQVIINNLCAYIRSPLPLAERAEQLDTDYAKDLQNDFDGDIEKFDADKRAFARDKAALEEERQVRLSIIKEMHEHLHNAEKPGPWSGFDYDFSNAHFFYPVDFSNSHFGASSRFFGAKFTGYADFFGAKFTGYADFSKAEFTGSAYFIDAEFTDAHFSKAEFTDAHFPMAKFTGNADFSWAKFTGIAHFSMAKFTGIAHFSKAKFTGNADFSKAKFTGNAHFFEAEFAGNADFSWAKFTGSADFFEAEFTGGANFSGATFEEKPIFEYELYSETFKAKFSHRADPEDYNFEVSHYSPYKIETKEQEHNGIKFVIPEDAELFDPDEPSEQGNNDGN